MGNILFFVFLPNLLLTLMRVTLQTVPNFKWRLKSTLFCETPNFEFHANPIRGTADQYI